jgi:hypothetical protein
MRSSDVATVRFECLRFEADLVRERMVSIATQIATERGSTELDGNGLRTLRH